MRREGVSLPLCTSQAKWLKEKLKLMAPLHNGIKGTISVSSSVKWTQ